MSEKKTNFIGWSGKTTSFKPFITTGETTSTVEKLSKIIKGQITIDRNRPKMSKSTPGVKQPPVAKLKPEPNPIFTGATKSISKSKISVKSNINEITTPFTAGTVDLSFNNGVGSGFDGLVFTSKVQTDGKIIVGGQFGYYSYNGNTYYTPYLVRLNSDGSPDLDFLYTFNSDDNGWYIDAAVRTIEILSNGKILIGGDFQYYYDNIIRYSSNIMRFNSDGSFDDTFYVGDGFNNSVFKIVKQPDGKILVGGFFSTYNNSEYDPANGRAYWRIIRLNYNGSPDLTFNPGYGINWDDSGAVFDILLQSNGKIILGGDFYNYDNSDFNYIVRLNSDGSIDNTFLVGDGFNDVVRSLGLQSDGKIIVGGYFNTYDNNDLFNGYIVRLGSNGEMDTRFGYGVNDVVYSLYVQSDDKILLGGGMNTFYIDNFNSLSINKLVRFHSDCKFDYSFYYDGIFNSDVFSITLDSNNKIYVGGYFNEDINSNPNFVFNYFGRLNNFILNYPYTYIVVSCAQPIDGEEVTYVVGSMTSLIFDGPTYSFQSISRPSVVVCGFVIDGYPSNEVDYFMVNTYADCGLAINDNFKQVSVNDCLTDSTIPATFLVDKKYQVGDILYVDFVLNNTISEGTPTFYKFAANIIGEIPIDLEGFPFWYYLPTINYVTYSSCQEAIEFNGLHYVAISCNEMEVGFPLIHEPIYDSISLLIPTGNNPVKILVDYLPTGNYEYISGGTSEIYSTVKFGSYENNYNTLCDLGLTSVSPSGIYNYNFDTYFNDMVYTSVEQPDGKILVGGNFTEYDGTPVKYLARLNSDGTLDTTFNMGNGFNDYIKAIALQPDGKILVGGLFTEYDGYAAGRIIRLNSDGSIDNGFTYLSEFNGNVRAIAIQKDGKIVVGGDFNTYYDFNCPKIARLNYDGTPDTTFIMGNGFNGGVYTINIDNEYIDDQFFHINQEIREERIIVGGWFTEYDGNNCGGIAKLSQTGELLPDFGEGFNRDTGGAPRVNQILKQPDGKLIVVGGGNNGNGFLFDYNYTWIPKNIVRLVKVGITYIIDTTFTTRDWDSNGGFDIAALSISQLSNGKYIVGGQFEYYGDNGNDYNDTGYLIRLNSNGTLDETFTYKISDNNVNKVLLLSSGKLLVGGWFNEDEDYLLELYIGEEYSLYSFNTCDGLTSNIFLPSNTELGIGNGINAIPIDYEPISTSGLDLVYDGSYDDDNFVIIMPTPFDITFLGNNYTSVNVSSNPYITFGDGGTPDDCCFDIPNEIPTSTELPGVYLSFACPDEIDNYDAQLYELYSGLTDGGNTMVIKYVGSDHCDEVATLVYGFKFYKDNSDYFDLIIESNTQFFNNDSTGGVSNGVDPNWLVSFDSSPLKAYRIGIVSSDSPIKANVNDNVTVCGNVGNEISSPQLRENSIGGSMYFDGTGGTNITVDYNAAMDLNSDSWTIEWFQYYTSTQECCLRVFDIGSNGSNEHIGVSLENGDIYVWVENTPYPYGLNTTILNTWCHFAITAENIGGTDWILRVFQDGVQLGSNLPLSTDINNFDGPTLLPLTIGSEGNGNSPFEGYITNFRWNKGTCYYTSNFTVPTSPLNVNGSQLLLLATDENNLIYDSSEQQIINENNVTWSSKTPFVNKYDFSLFTATNYTQYNSCDECGQKYNSRIFIRDGANPNKVETFQMSKSDIDKVNSLGPIFTTRGVECYEILKYKL